MAGRLRIAESLKRVVLLGSSRGKASVGWTMAILATVAFSTVPPVARAAIVSGMSPTTLLAARYSIAIVLLGSTLRFTTTGNLRVDRRGLLIAGAVGSLHGVATLTFFLALNRITASVASILVSIYPLVVLGLLALRGENFTYRHLIRLTIGLGGVYLLIGHTGQVDGLGALLVLVAAVTYAIHLVLVQWFLGDYGVRAVATYIAAGMTVIVVGTWLAQGAEWHDPGWQGWLAIGLLAVVGTYLAHLAMLSGVRGIGSGQTALLAPLETLLAVLWSILLLQERLTLPQWLGGSLIVLSALLAVRRLRRPPWNWRVWLRS
ncbi:MAG: DMT family transporter [Anaerolineales bacterium]